MSILVDKQTDDAVAHEVTITLRWTDMRPQSEDAITVHANAELGVFVDSIRRRQSMMQHENEESRREARGTLWYDAEFIELKMVATHSETRRTELGITDPF